MLGSNSLSTNFTRPLLLNFAKDMMPQPSKLAAEDDRCVKLRTYACSGLGSRFSNSSKAIAGFFSSYRIEYT